MSFVPPMISALYDGNGVLHVFGVAADGSVWGKSRPANWPWQDIPWFPLDGNLTSMPTVVCSGGPRLDVFGVGFNGQAFHKAYDGSRWQSGWDSLDGALVGPIAAISPGQGRVNLVGMGTDGGYYLNQWSSSGPPSGWQRLGVGVFLSPPTIVEVGFNDMLVVGMAMDRGYDIAFWQGGSPASVNWEKHGGEFQGPPAAVLWGNGQLDVFGLGTNGAIYQKWMVSGQWSPGWNGFPQGDFQSRPVAISREANLIDVFAVGTDGFLYGKQRTSSDWLPGWQQLDLVGGWASAPAIAVAHPTQVDAFAVRSDGAIWTTAMNSNSPTGWTFEPWTSLGQAPTPDPQNSSFSFLAQPSAQLGSSFNYFMSAAGEAIPDLTVTLSVNEAIVDYSFSPPAPGETPLAGFSVQLNCYAEGSTASHWQQVFFRSTTGENLELGVQYWDPPSTQMVLCWSATTRFSFPRCTVPAGYALQIALSSADGGPTEGITNVTFSVRDLNNVWWKHDTYFIPAPKVAPLVAATLVLVGPASKERATLSYGAGTIEYSSSIPLAPALNLPLDADTTVPTAEQANSFYGLLSRAAAPTHIQTFQLAPIDT